MNFFRAVVASLHLTIFGFRAQGQKSDADVSNAWGEQSCKNIILKIQFQGDKFGRAICHCFSHDWTYAAFVDKHFFLSSNYWNCLLVSRTARLPFSLECACELFMYVRQFLDEKADFTPP